MMKISEIPLEELRKDLIETEGDIALCRSALALGIMNYYGKSVKKRLDVNIKIQSMIKKEIRKRK